MKEILEQYGPMMLGVAMTVLFVAVVWAVLYGTFRDALILAADMML